MAGIRQLGYVSRRAPSLASRTALVAVVLVGAATACGNGPAPGLVPLSAPPSSGGPSAGAGSSAGPAAAQTPRATGDRQGAEAAGRAFARTFFTYDYRQEDPYVAAVLRQTTGAFRDDFKPGRKNSARP